MESLTVFKFSSDFGSQTLLDHFVVWVSENYV